MCVHGWLDVLSFFLSFVNALWFSEQPFESFDIFNRDDLNHPLTFWVCFLGDLINLEKGEKNRFDDFMIKTKKTNS